MSNTHYDGDVLVRTFPVARDQNVPCPSLSTKEDLWVHKLGRAEVRPTWGTSGFEDSNDILGILSCHLWFCFSTGVCLIFLCSR